MGEITLTHLIVVGVPITVGIFTLSGFVWKIFRHLAKLEDIAEDFDAMKSRGYSTERELEKHIAVADERDKTAKEEINRLRDRVNGHK